MHGSLFLFCLFILNKLFVVSMFLCFFFRGAQDGGDHIPSGGGLNALMINATGGGGDAIDNNAPYGPGQAFLFFDTLCQENEQRKKKKD